MMCTTPFVASLSADVTLASWLTETWPSRDSTNRWEPSSVFTSCTGLRSLAWTAAPGTTWYSKIASNSFTFLGSNNRLSISAGILANASLDGANTVNGPLPSKGVTSLPAVSAATSVERSLSPSASWTMFLVGASEPPKWCGMSTWSMMCTTPFVASLSADVTLASWLTETWPSRDSTNRWEPSSVFTSCTGLRSLLWTAAPGTTWYSKIASNSFTFLGSNNRLSSSAGILANASLDGANTVNGPLPSKGVTRLPAFSAATSVERSLSPAASSTMFLVGAGEGGAGVGGLGLCDGMSTWSMMCTTPFVASLSAAVTCDTWLM